MYIYEVKDFQQRKKFHLTISCFAIIVDVRSTFIVYCILVLVNYAHQGGVGEIDNCNKIDEYCL